MRSWINQQQWQSSWINILSIPAFWIELLPQPTEKCMAHCYTFKDEVPSWVITNLKEITRCAERSLIHENPWNNGKEINETSEDPVPFDPFEKSRFAAMALCKDNDFFLQFQFCFKHSQSQSEQQFIVHNKYPLLSLSRPTCSILTGQSPPGLPLLIASRLLWSRINYSYYSCHCRIIQSLRRGTVMTIHVFHVIAAW